MNALQPGDHRAGEAGQAAAHLARKLGGSVAIIDRELFGGLVSVLPAKQERENMMNAKRARELVARERARIEQSLRELNAEVRAEGELHQQQNGEAYEAGTDLDREEIDLALVADLQEELKAVGRAEARIAAGKYGRSIDTGAQIPDERLEAVPLAERTIEEQRRLESGVA